MQGLLTGGWDLGVPSLKSTYLTPPFCKWEKILKEVTFLAPSHRASKGKAGFDYHQPPRQDVGGDVTCLQESTGWGQLQCGPKLLRVWAMGWCWLKELFVIAMR